MSDRLDDDLMEDLMDEPEGRGQHAMDEYDEASDELDELEDAYDEGEESFEGEESAEEFEELVADALEAEEFDEFWGKIGGFLKKVGRGVGSAARVVAPLASALPIPQAQAIGKIAGLVGNVLADEGDEFDALEELADYGEDEAVVRVAAPAIAGLAIRAGLKHHAARVPTGVRRDLVRTVTAATKHIARAHGSRAVVAVPGIVRHARTIAVRRGLPASALPHLVRRIANKAVRSPNVLRKLHRNATLLRTGSGRHHGHGHGSVRAQGGVGFGAPTRIGSRQRTSGGGMRGAVCPGCGRHRSWRLDGPIELSIRSL